MQSLKNGTQLGAYTLTRIIGRGGMGEVYEALENKLQRQVALKVIAPMNPDEHDYDELIRRFMQEARTLAKVNHPNIVTIYGIDKIGDVQFIAMEFVDGASFKEILQKQNLTADQAAPLFEQMVEGLRCLHDNQILHRDLKPHNILLRIDGKIKILDFGIAKNVGGDVSEHTVVGLIVGTIPYMAPEVQAGVKASPRSDYWSLGAIFYECLVGIPLAVALRESKNPKEVPFSNEAILSIPHEMRAIICRMLAFNPNDRYATADQIIDDLKRFRRERSPVTSEHMKPLMERVEAIVQARRRGEIWKAPLEALKNVFGGGDAPAPEVEKLPLPPPPSSQPSDRTRTAIAAPTGRISAGIDPYTRTSGPQRRKKSRRKKSVDLTSYLFAGVVSLTAVLTAMFLSQRDQSRQVVEPPPVAAVAPAPMPQYSYPAVKAPPMPTPMPAASVDPIALQSPYDREVVWLEPTKLPTLTWSRALSPGEYDIQIATDDAFRDMVVQEAVSGAFYRPAEVLPEGTYFWRLRPRMQGRNAVFAQSFVWATLSPPNLILPEDDEVFEISSRSKETSVSLIWQCKAGASRYRVQVSNIRDFRQILREQAVDGCQWQTSLPKGPAFWRVRMEGVPSATPLWSDARAFTIRPEASAPILSAQPPASNSNRALNLAEPKPTKLNQTFVLKINGKPRDLASLATSLKQKPILEWREVKGAKSYQVQISTVADFSHLLTEESTKASRLEWKSPSPGVFFWRVRAVGAGRDVSDYSQKAQLQVVLPGPSLKPQYKFQVPRIEPQPVELSWTEVPFATKYVIQFSQDRKFTGSNEQVTPEPRVFFEPTPASYFVRVAAADEYGTRISEFSSISTMDIEQSNSALSRPTLTRPSSGAKAPSRGGKISISFTWTEIAGADAYALELASDPDFKNVIEQLRFTEPKAVMKQIELKGRVYWRVRAQSSQGISDWSAPFFFEVK